MSKIPRVGTKEYDEWEEKQNDHARDKSNAMRIALKVDEELKNIPSWDFALRERFIEELSPQEHKAMQYVSDNSIVLDDYREPTSPNSNSINVAPNNLIEFLIVLVSLLCLITS